MEWVLNARIIIRSQAFYSRAPDYCLNIINNFEFSYWPTVVRLRSVQTRDAFARPSLNVTFRYFN